MTSGERRTIAVCTTALFAAHVSQEITDAELVDGLETLAVIEACDTIRAHR